MRKLSIGEENKLITPGEEERNKRSFINILPTFCLNKTSSKRVIEYMKGKRSKDEKFLDEYFNLNESLRAFFEFEILKDASEIYDFYRKKVIDALHRILQINNFSVSQLNTYIGIPYDLLLDYNVFISNIIEINGQPLKLFKLLSKKSILDQEDLNIINKKKLSTSKIIVCISRNPIDYLFSATGQSFTTCENLESDYGGAFYMGLGGLCLDPNRFLLFSLYRKSLWNIKDNRFRYFKYLSRSWGLICKNNLLHVVKQYPEEKINFHKFLEDTGFQKNKGFLKADGKFRWKIPKYKNNLPSHIYMDTLTLNIKRKNYEVEYVLEGGVCGCVTQHNYHDGFENLTGRMDELQTRKRKCRKCGRIILFPELSIHGLYCDVCSKDKDMCLQCEKIFKKSELTYINGGYVCKSCKKMFATICNRCGIFLFKSSALKSDYSEQIWLCRNCSSFNNICDSCKKYYPTDRTHSCVEDLSERYTITGRAI